MKTFKAYVRNKTRPEGCIAEQYIQEETIIYCNQYRGKQRTILLEKLEKRFDGVIPRQQKLKDIVDDGSNSDDVGPVGSSQSVILAGIEYEQARIWVLKSHPSYDVWEGYVQLAHMYISSLLYANFDLVMVSNNAQEAQRFLAATI